MLRAVMNNWFAGYHHALLLHLLSGAVMLGVFCLWLLLAGGFRSARRLARHMRGRWQRIGQNLYGAFGVKRFSWLSAQSSILFKFLCSVGEPFLCPGLHPGSEPRGAAVNIAVGTAGGGAKRC